MRACVARGGLRARGLSSRGVRLQWRCGDEDRARDARHERDRVVAIGRGIDVAGGAVRALQAADHAEPADHHGPDTSVAGGVPRRCDERSGTGGEHDRFTRHAAPRVPCVEDLPAPRPILCEVERNEQGMRDAVCRRVHDERSRLHRDAGMTRLARRRSKPPLERAQLDDVGDIQVGWAVGHDGYRCAELGCCDRATEFPGALWRPRGQRDTYRLPDIGERPEEVGSECLSVVEESCLADRGQRFARRADR